MTFRFLLPAVLAVGLVSFVGTQANAFDLLDGLLGASGYGGKAACCDGKGSCDSTGCAQKGAMQKGCVQKGGLFGGSVQKGSAQKGGFFGGCAQKGAAQKDCSQKGSCQKGSGKKGCAPRPCLLQEACCHVRIAASNLHCRTQAVCDSIKYTLFCPRSCCCCDTKGDFADDYDTELSYSDIPVQTDLEVQK